MNAINLLAELTNAFAQEPYPGDLHIVHDNSGYDLEALSIYKAFKQYTWQTLPQDLMHQEQSCLGFLSKQGFRYYLPAFMQFALTDYHAADMIPDNIILNLTLPIEADVITAALDIKRYQLDEEMPTVDWNDILQNRLRTLNQQVHDFIARASLFSPAQGRVIRYFLEYMSKEHSQEFSSQEPSIAIQRYWFQF